jgi:hypothetical protein
MAEQAEFDIVLTTDQNIRYRQNLKSRKIAIVVLTGSTKWSRIQLHLERMVVEVDAAKPGSHTEISIRFE